MKYIHYMTLEEDIEVNVSVPYKNDGTEKDGNAGDIYVYIEEPDEIYCFKTLIVDLNKMLIVKREGLTDKECSKYIDFISNNKKMMVEMSNEEKEREDKNA